MLVPTEESFRLYHEMLAAYSTMQQSVIRPEVTNTTRKTCVPKDNSAYNMFSPMTQQQRANAAYQQGKSALFEGTNFHRRITSPSVHPQSRKCETYGAKCESYKTQCNNIDRKRKYSECDGVLDLSMKKTKVDHSPSSVPRTFNYVLDQDSPVDFSMKKQTCSDNLKSTHTVKQHNFVSPSHQSYSVGNKSYSVQSKPYSVQSSHSRSNSSSPATSRTCSSGQTERVVQHKPSYKQSLYNTLWNGVTKHLDKDMTKWTVDNVCSFLGCLEGCTEYMKVKRFIAPLSRSLLGKKEKIKSRHVEIFSLFYPLGPSVYWVQVFLHNRF